jgi:GT2 family glycosyltransferase
VICTRNRTEALKKALASVLACDYEQFEVIVVDNASDDDSTVRYVAGLQDPRVRSLVEPVPGLSVARNAGVLAAGGEVVAFTDDDVVVDPTWLRWLGNAIREAPAAGCVTGLVPGGELRTREQCWFDNQVNWSKNLARQEFSIDRPVPGNKLFPFQVGLFGTGANFAMPRDVIRQLGGFDEALGAGSPAGSGEDGDMFVRVLAAGRPLVYEPAAIVWHRHRADLAGLLAQVRGYDVGLGAWMAKVVCDRSLAPLALRRLGSVLARIRRLTTPAEVVDADLTAGMRGTRVRNILSGPLAYAVGRRQRRRARPRQLNHDHESMDRGWGSNPDDG